MSIYCSFTVVCETFLDSRQLFAEWATFPRSTVVLKSALLMLSLRRGSVGKLKQIDQTAFFLSLMLLGCSAAGQ